MSPLRRVAPTKRRRPRRAGLGNPEPEVASPLQGHTRGDGALPQRTPQPLRPRLPLRPGLARPRAREGAVPAPKARGNTRGEARRRTPPLMSSPGAGPRGGTALLPSPHPPAPGPPRGSPNAWPLLRPRTGGFDGRDPRQHRGFRRFAGGGGRGDGCGSTGPEPPPGPRSGGPEAPEAKAGRGRGGPSYVRDGGGENEPLVPRAAAPVPRPTGGRGRDGGPRAGAPRCGGRPGALPRKGGPGRLRALNRDARRARHAPHAPRPGGPRRGRGWGSAPRRRGILPASPVAGGFAFTSRARASGPRAPSPSPKGKGKAHGGPLAPTPRPRCRSGSDGEGTHGAPAARTPSSGRGPSGRRAPPHGGGRGRGPRPLLAGESSASLRFASGCPLRRPP